VNATCRRRHACSAAPRVSNGAARFERRGSLPATGFFVNSMLC